MDEPRVRSPHEVDYGELPELTRTLRALGSSRRTAGALQTQFFHPLLDARRKASGARTPALRIRAFDATELERALEKAISRILTEWPDTRDSVRRAIRAELQDRVADYARALTLLSERANIAIAADETERTAAWRAWTIQLAATFDAADRSWMALRSVVQALPTKQAR